MTTTEKNQTDQIHRQAQARLDRMIAERAELTDKVGPWSATDERHAASLDHSIRLTMETLAATRSWSDGR